MVERSRIIDLFDKNNARGAYSLFDSTHPLKIYLGTNNEGLRSLTVVSNSNRVEVFSSKIIDVGYEQYSDNDLSLSFNLLDDRFAEFFYSFCEDVIKNTYSAQESDGFLPVVERYEAWQKFFKRNNNFLSESEIKGLIGELLFIRHYMLPNYGEDRTIAAYIGIEGGHKDFELGETWYEIKAVHNGSNSVNISSLEQLDSDRDGHLEVVVLDDGAQSEISVNLNILASDISSMFSGDNLRKFNDKLLEKGYVPNDYYNTYSYIPVSATGYLVKNDFPKLKKEALPDGILSAKYELSLLAIKDYKESTWI